MNKQILNKFRRLFETQLQTSAYNTRIINEDLSVSPDDRYDEIDQAAIDLEQSMLTKLKNREVLYVKKIKDAIKRIEAGSFGECQECGEDIELRRLEARPTATLCIACKEEQERKEFNTNVEGNRFAVRYPAIFS